MKKIIILLLCFLILLISIDIFTGIWYWNRLNLLFDPDNFNKIATPVAGVFAVVVYSCALFISFNQNKILKSQNIKPYFEKEINELIIKTEKSIIPGITSEKKYYSLINYIKGISDALIKLEKNKDFQDDIIEFEKGKTFDRNYFLKRSYDEIATFLTTFYISAYIKPFYSQVIELIIAINKSSLISDDKFFLKKRIKEELLMDYLTYMDFWINNSTIIAKVPVMYEYKNYPAFIHLHETEFRNFYDRFNKIL